MSGANLSDIIHMWFICRNYNEDWTLSAFSIAYDIKEQLLPDAYKNGPGGVDACVS